MLGIDTNVLVRFLVRDNEVQFEKARKLIKREVAAGRRVFVSQLVLLETEWVLRSRYGLPKIEIITFILPLAIFVSSIVPLKLVNGPSVTLTGSPFSNMTLGVGFSLASLACFNIVSISSTFSGSGLAPAPTQRAPP